MTSQTLRGASGRTLILFTESYPYHLNRESTFIDPIIPALRSAFDQLVIVPSRIGGDRSSVVSDDEVDETLAAMIRRTSSGQLLLRALRSRIAYEDLARNPGIALSQRAIRLLVSTVGLASATRDWLETVLATGGASQRVVAFAFWMDHTAIGSAMVKQRGKPIAVAARVNGADLYLERHDPPYLPARHLCFEYADRIFAASAHALRYVADHYPQSDRTEVASLGVPDPGFASTPSPSGELVIASASGLVPVKRVSLIAAGIRRLAEVRRDAPISWHHFGDGPERPAVERDITGLPSNVVARLHGHRPPSELMAFYRDNPVDVFVNVSQSEGGAPVAAMEAASCSIPIVATSVGGNPEIVSPRNGVLLSADPSPTDLADAFAGLIDDPERVANLRQGSRAVWNERYRATDNAAHLANRLLALRGSP